VKWPYDASLREPKARSHFAVERPNELWLADVTYVSTWQGWSYNTRRLHSEIGDIPPVEHEARW
jgi:transposase InsO family protein